jgi:diguanylate cyclase (GGDEF)-like protein/PAS domain S-box-containing protein
VLVRTSPDAILMTDLKGQVTAWNPGAERLYGWSAEAAIGGPVDRLEPADRAGEAAGLIRRAASGQAIEGFETERLRSDGARVWVSLAVTAQQDRRGRTTGVIVIARDISERVRGEAERARHAALVEHSADAIVAVDAEGRITAWNHAATALYGYSEREALGRFAAELVPSTDGESERLPHRVLAGEVVRRESSRRRRDGGILTIASTISPIRDRTGVIVGAVGLSRDVTLQRRSQAALQAAQARFQAAFENAPIGMALVRGADGTIIDANDALCEMTGEQLRGRRLESLYDPEDRERLRQDLERLRTGALTHLDVESRYRHRDGHVVHAQVRGAMVGHDADRYLVLQALDISDRKRFEGQLRRLADHDALTGLYNRRRFGEELEWAVAYAQRYGRPAALLALDVDHFSYINDSYGHATGDELLGMVAALLRSRLRETDVVGRLGGDEFGVILAETALEDAEAIARALVDDARRSAQTQREGRPVRATLSIGIREIEPEAQLTPAEQLAEAELARAEAKERGRDRFAVSGRGDGTARTRALSWVERLREALEHDRFVLYEQPILDLELRVIDRSELLIRLHDGDGGLVLPGAFLPAAERYGLIKAIDRWVTARAIRLLAARQAAGHERVGLDVNLSGASITDPTVMDFIAAEVRNAPIDPTGLIFEVTETAAIANVARARSLARGLADLGCQFALDDFGSGFGSFYYLKHLPFDVVKIDGDFIKELPATRTDQLTVRAIVQIARGLGKTTTAEFVGDAATVELLREFGVNYAQGFHIGRPEPAEVP